MSWRPEEASVDGQILLFASDIKADSYFTGRATRVAKQLMGLRRNGFEGGILPLGELKAAALTEAETSPVAASALARGVTTARGDWVSRRGRICPA